MKSPKLVNYEIRPCKFVERRILLSSLFQIITHLKQEYQYIGFGGLAFTDFKLFHKELNISNMYSIEGAFTPEKLEFNKPFSCIKILHGLSKDKLKEIDLSKPSIVWMDYDGVLTMDVFNDIFTLFTSLPHGSVYIMSCNRQLQNNDADLPEPYSKEELEKIFIRLVPFDIEENCCSDVNAPNTIRRMIFSFCHKTLKERNKSDSTKLKFSPLYNIIYQERGGARMFTCGGIILDDNFSEDLLHIKEFDYLNQETPFEINIPNVTHREALFLNQIMFILYMKLFV